MKLNFFVQIRKQVSKWLIFRLFWNIFGAWHIYGKKNRKLVDNCQKQNAVERLQNRDMKCNKGFFRLPHKLDYGRQWVKNNLRWTCWDISITIISWKLIMKTSLKKSWVLGFLASEKIMKETILTRVQCYYAVIKLVIKNYQGCCVFTQLRLDMRFLRFFALCIWRFEKFKRKVNLH